MARANSGATTLGKRYAFLARQELCQVDDVAFFYECDSLTNRLLYSTSTSHNRVPYVRWESSHVVVRVTTEIDKPCRRFYGTTYNQLVD